jgi:metal-dependent amidase/aminoacylase/carboxypeptidase family protein
MGAKIEVSIHESYGPLINNKELTDLVEKNARLILGEGKVVLEEYPDLSCEDFSYFAEEKPSCYFHLGCYSPMLGERRDLHNPYFTIDENCMKVGVRLQVENIISLLNEGV